MVVSVKRVCTNVGGATFKGNFSSHSRRKKKIGQRFSTGFFSTIINTPRKHQGRASDLIAQSFGRAFKVAFDALQDRESFFKDSGANNLRGRKKELREKGHGATNFNAVKVAFDARHDRVIAVARASSETPEPTISAKRRKKKGKKHAGRDGDNPPLAETYCKSPLREKERDSDKVSRSCEVSRDFGRDGDLSPRAERKLAFIGGFGSLETQTQFVRRMNLSCGGSNSSLIPFSYGAENPKCWSRCQFVLVISGRLDGFAGKCRPSEAL
ncbi:unnamed protein product [Caenorhabditis auriculariae]|uniref:Uncharacterized protein n=1 Tax=Caenorhabditis auriculariae TaxID=2777116 RepID=A0A8S1HS42_9PELO|nr:unnamed protein product [Caenorhabditis auriculariae]